MIVPVVIGFSTLGPIAAGALLIWCAAVALCDNLLKPILFGRGVKVPSLVIFLGAIGGMLTMGIIGLFLGAVVLALGFALFMAWLADPVAESPPGGASPPPARAG
jgi:predicted PurR-regulated permease PerM